MWEALTARLAGTLDLGGQSPIRVWSACCSSGEEPFTIAMVLAEALGAEAFGTRVKIYATDIDDEALSQARMATYAGKSLEAIPEALRVKYFTSVGTSFVINRELRRAVVFGRHDLERDTPMARLELLVCRNALMYFNSETQTRILQRLHFALKPGGTLLLGKAEMLLTHAELFTPADLKLRLFARAVRATAFYEQLDARSAPRSEVAVAVTTALEHSAFETGTAAQIVVDAVGRLALVNALARQTLSVSGRDIGRPFHELEISCRPAELRSRIEDARVQQRPVRMMDVERPVAHAEPTHFDIDVAPLYDEAGTFIGAQITFHDVTHVHRLGRDLRHAQVRLEAAHGQLQTTSKELETMNEELQSMVEELETTNEELQTFNDELKTMNAELQSTNEAFHMTNEDLRRRAAEVVKVNVHYSSVLGALRSGIAVLDPELRVRTWNAKMADLWGVRPEEAEAKPFTSLDIGLPVADLAQDLRACLLTGAKSQQRLDCTNRRGNKVSCNVGILPLLRVGQIDGVLVVVGEGS